MKIGSLDETEGWTQFLALEPDDPMASVGQRMVSMAAWVADQEREVGRLSPRGPGGDGHTVDDAPSGWRRANGHAGQS